MRSQRRPASLFVAIVTLAPFANLVHAADAEKVERLDIVDRAIDFHGGDLFGKVEIGLTVSSKSGTFDVVSRIDDGLFDYRVRRMSDDGVESLYRHTNDGISVVRDGKPVELDAREEQRARDFVSARLYFVLLPSRLNDPNTFKQDLGLETWGGRDLHKVKVSFTPGTSTDADDEYLYWFDSETGRLEQFAYSFETGNGGLRFRQLENYRRVGGILFADQSNFAVNGHGMRVDQIDPEFVAETMELLSMVRFTDIRVEPLR